MTRETDLAEGIHRPDLDEDIRSEPSAIAGG